MVKEKNIFANGTSFTKDYNNNQEEKINFNNRNLRDHPRLDFMSIL